MANDWEDRILEFIRHFLKAHGYAPTYDEIKDGMGMKSKTSVAYYLNKLEIKGKIVRKERSPRTIRILE